MKRINKTLTKAFVFPLAIAVYSLLVFGWRGLVVWLGLLAAAVIAYSYGYADGKRIR